MPHSGTPHRTARTARGGRAFRAASGGGVTHHGGQRGRKPLRHGDPRFTPRTRLSFRGQHGGVDGIALNAAGFQGLGHDEGLDAIDNRARVYLPPLGRFAQTDPLGYPDGLNPYAGYHVMWGGVDPWGLEGRYPSLGGTGIIAPVGVNGSPLVMPYHEWPEHLKPRYEEMTRGVAGRAGALIDKYGEPALDLGMDVVGTFDPTGTVDSANATRLAATGRYGDAALTAAGVVPIWGDIAGKGTKWLRRLRFLCENGEPVAKYGDDVIASGDEALELLEMASRRGADAPVRGAGTSGASNVNAQAALRSKLSALENAQNTAARTRTLPDGRVRYYGAETPARTAGPTRGASYVTEYNPRTGQVRSWMESYDHAGNVTRVHPKMINGQTVNSPHYPPTGKELGQ